ncbi:hypothetical protein BDV41DRAFT_541965 [Aspergillus transmontanensis]|uniref:Uncharacterized protein n=1 Tax=Aspergillus transmontanensis TaxID=1034304 RepID=A0A5N6VWP9_9EURO|nr:hypothetical protein BDV41DRAFT_541965 [Aspergillus transmontanensis]
MKFFRFSRTPLADRFFFTCFRPTRPTSSHMPIPTYPDSLSMSLAAATSGYRRFVRTVCTKLANVEVIVYYSFL